jgi:histone H3/H4
MAEKETLVVASKVKAYIKARSGLKCSAAVIDALSDKVRGLCDAAIEAARADKRKTVQDRDV